MRCEATLTDYFYNDTQPAFAQTRIISQELKLAFVGNQPFVFRPGMVFEGQVSVLFNDQVALSAEDLSSAQLNLTGTCLLNDGQSMELPTLGTGLPDQGKTLQELEDWLGMGVFSFKWTIPKDATKLKIKAAFESESLGTATTVMVPHAVHQSEGILQLRTSCKNITVGGYVVLHAKTDFPLDFFDWLIIAKNIVLKSGREFGENVHPETKTFSEVVSSEMSPGFHVLAYASLPSGQVVSGKSFP